MDPRIITNNLIKQFPTRTRDVLRRRFGLSNNKSQTLQEIGNAHNRCRERVRQITESALIKIRQDQKSYQPLLIDLKKVFNKNSQVISEEKINQIFTPWPGHYFLILHADNGFCRFWEDENFKTHWVTSIEASDKAKQSIQNLTQHLENKKEPIIKNEVLNYAPLSYLDISKLIMQNIFGEFGLVFWPEIMPKGVKDKAYLILKQAQKPLHYAEITDLINKTNFADNKKAYVKTVHNELIRDPRFVLEGRGVYFLRDAEKKRS